MTIEDLLVRQGINRKLGYVSMGMSDEDASQRAINDVLPGYSGGSGMSGLGQAPSDGTSGASAAIVPPGGFLSTVESDVSAISTVVSPWLWILSIGGFAMSVYNTTLIKKMFGSWKRAKKRLLR
jgi:hypothetical protein